MWRALSLIEGSWQEIEPIVVEPQLPSSSLIAAAIESRYPNDELLRYVRTEAETAQTSRDAIQLWARQAEEANAEFGWRSSAKLEALDETLSYYPTWTEPDSDMRPATLAWHDATAIILRLNGSEDEILLEYSPSYRDQNRVDRLRHLHGGSDHKLETILDWRGYFGARSAIIDGWNEFVTQGGRLLTRVCARNGFLVGYVLRRLTGDQPTLQTNPTRKCQDSAGGRTGRLVSLVGRYDLPALPDR